MTPLTSGTTECRKAGRLFDSLIRAKRERRTIVAVDTDFGAILALRKTKLPSVIPFAHYPAKQLELLLANLPTVEEAIVAGSAITLEDSRVRIRPLPIKMTGRGAPWSLVRGRSSV